MLRVHGLCVAQFVRFANATARPTCTSLRSPRFRSIVVLLRCYLATVVVAPDAAVVSVAAPAEVSVAAAAPMVVVAVATVVLVDFFLLQPVARIGIATAIAVTRSTLRVFINRI